MEVDQDSWPTDLVLDLALRDRPRTSHARTTPRRRVLLQWTESERPDATPASTAAPGLRRPVERASRRGATGADLSRAHLFVRRRSIRGLVSDSARSTCPRRRQHRGQGSTVLLLVQNPAYCSSSASPQSVTSSRGGSRLGPRTGLGGFTEQLPNGIGTDPSWCPPG
jgi:hypothetical protein